jgi:hypothetical protein
MEAIKAYNEGKFNSCNCEWQTATRCKITLVDDVNQLKGSFTAEYDTNRVMVDVKDDTGMKPITRGGAPLPPEPPALPAAGP